MDPENVSRGVNFKNPAQPAYPAASVRDFLSYAYRLKALTVAQQRT